MKKLILVGSLFISFSGYAQFWFGPKIGGQVIFPKYTSSLRLDTFSVSSKVNWHAGIAMDYSTEGMFEVHTELVYVRLNNRTRNKSLYPALLDSKTVNHFITAPIMARMMFLRRSRLKFFLETGPRLSWWLGGKGTLKGDFVTELGKESIDYTFIFSNQDVDLIEGELGDFFVTKPNRLQYALDFGFGWLFDINPSQRVIADAKVSFGHSFMAFNDGNKFEGAGEEYMEDTEYTTNMIMLSIAYMFGYDPVLTTKGKSTSKVKTKKR